MMDINFGGTEIDITGVLTAWEVAIYINAKSGARR